MRVALVLLLVHGLAPGLGEVAETAVHYAVEGHLAHSEADRGDLGEQGDEHGCGTTAHLCSCCASQALLAGPAPAPVAAGLPLARLAPGTGALASLHEPAPPHRPPIAW
jgi:hypothetical protein